MTSEASRLGGMDFLNSEDVREPMYLYPTRGFTLPKHHDLPDKKGKSIIENEDFAKD